MRDVKLTTDERSLLEWLAQEDFSQYGECHGKTLDALLAKNFAQVHSAGERRGVFIAQGDGLMYRAVSATDAGRAALANRSPPS